MGPQTAPRSPASYRERLRIEGGVLAGAGALGSVALLVFAGDATRGPASTLGQLALVAVLLAWLGPRGVRRALVAAEPVEPVEPAAGGGEPTPLWQLPLIVAVLATPLLAAGAPDAALRVTGGCLLVGLAQALLLAGLVGRAERAGGRVFIRRPGSRILRGTRLGWWPAQRASGRAA